VSIDAREVKLKNTTIARIRKALIYFLVKILFMAPPEQDQFKWGLNPFNALSSNQGRGLSASVGSDNSFLRP
jgi:hypothetical protein